eukprot:gene11974-16027_t
MSDSRDTASKDKKYAATNDVFLLGITTVLGGQLIAWNVGFESGYWVYITAIIFMASGYFTFSLCLAELASCLPFAGGSYAYIRLTMGPLLGFMTGCCESIEYILYVVASVYPLGELVTEITGISRFYEPSYWFVFFLISLSAQVFSQRIFWWFSNGLAVITILSIVLYVVIVIVHLVMGDDVSELSYQHQHDKNDTISSIAIKFMRCLPLAAWFFVGVECLPLAGNTVKKVTKTLPESIIMCTIALFVLCGSLLVTVPIHSTSLDELAELAFPLNPGFMHGLKISNKMATIFSFPGLFATSFGFVFAYGQQIRSMAHSGLFPPILGREYGKRKSPYIALIFGSFVAYMIMLMIWITKDTSFIVAIFGACVIGSFIVYINVSICYIIFKVHYSGIQRNFTSPLGIYGAAYCGFMFTVATIAAVGAKREQFFSAEEQGVLLVGYIIKRNNYTRIKNQNKKLRSSNSSISSLISMSHYSRSFKASSSSHITSKKSSNKTISYLSNFIGIEMIDEREDDEEVSSDYIHKNGYKQKNNIKNHQIMENKINNQELFVNNNDNNNNNNNNNNICSSNSLDFGIPNQRKVKPLHSPKNNTANRIVTETINEFDQMYNNNSNVNDNNNDNNSQKESIVPKRRRSSLLRLSFVGADSVSNKISDLLTNKLIPLLRASLNEDDFHANADRLVCEKLLEKGLSVSGDEIIDINQNYISNIINNKNDMSYSNHYYDDNYDNNNINNNINNNNNNNINNNNNNNNNNEEEFHIIENMSIKKLENGNDYVDTSEDVIIDDRLYRASRDDEFVAIQRKHLLNKSASRSHDNNV